MTDLPDEITVGDITYRLRRFTPKRKGQKNVGHDWIRDVAQGHRRATPLGRRGGGPHAAR